MTDQRRELGNAGERIAAEFLLRRHYRVLQTNYQTRHGEIDIVALDPAGQLVFVEVKTRSNNQYSLPESAIRFDKIKKMQKVAMDYLAREKVHEENYRFDSIGVEWRVEDAVVKVRQTKNILV